MTNNELFEMIAKAIETTELQDWQQEDFLRKLLFAGVFGNDPEGRFADAIAAW